MNVPVRKNNLTADALTYGLLTLRVIHRKGAYMSGGAGDVFGLHAAQSHCGPDDGLLIAEGDVGTSKSDIGKDVPGVGRVGADLRLPVPRERSLDPIGSHDGDHHGPRLVILVEVDSVGNDMGDLGNRYPATPVRFKNLSAILLNNIRKLRRDGWLNIEAKE